MSSCTNVWNAIVKETVAAQESEGEQRGMVRNFLLKGYYQRETAFAAKIFAAEYRRNGNPEYRQRAESALAAISTLLGARKIEEGIDEPVWTPRGIVQRRGSIPATILLLEAAMDAAGMLEQEFHFNVLPLVDYLQKCYLGKGRFYHDAITSAPGNYPHVINTTAMSYYFLESVRPRVADHRFISSELPVIRKTLLDSMRGDGFFPYNEPSFLQRTVYSFSRFIPATAIKLFNLVAGDASIFFGDGLHHLIAVYYYCKGRRQTDTALTARERKKIIAAWTFIRQHLKKNGEGIIRFDFSWEPKPRGYRHCNFIDTTTCFYILGLLEYLVHFQIIDTAEAKRLREGLLRHIETVLLRASGEVPCIAPYDGPLDIQEKIMPRPAESIFHKGAVMADIIIHTFGEEIVP